MTPQEAQKRASEAQRAVGKLEHEERTLKLAWEDTRVKLNKARSEAEAANARMHSIPGGSPQVPVPTYDEMLVVAQAQQPDLTADQVRRLVGRYRMGMQLDRVGVNWEKSHGGVDITGDEVQDVNEHAHVIPSASELYGPMKTE
jgi:hypothetical protein